MKRNIEEGSLFSRSSQRSVLSATRRYSIFRVCFVVGSSGYCRHCGNHGEFCYNAKKGSKSIAMISTMMMTMSDDAGQSADRLDLEFCWQMCEIKQSLNAFILSDTHSRRPQIKIAFLFPLIELFSDEFMLLIDRSTEILSTNSPAFVPSLRGNFCYRISIWRIPSFWFSASNAKRRFSMSGHFSTYFSLAWRSRNNKPRDDANCSMFTLSRSPILRKF